MADSVANIFLRYQELSKQVGEVANQFTGIRKEVEDNTTRLLNLQNEDAISLQRRHERNVESINQTVAFIELLEKSLRGLESTAALANYSTAITQLNSPTNDELGFKLSDVLNELIETRIFKGKRIRQKARFLSVLTSVVNNPITRNVAGLIPGVSAAVTSLTTVSNMVCNLVANDPNIDASEKDLQDFQNDLGRYLLHYEKLNKAESDLQINLNNLKLKIEALRTVTNEFIKEQVIELYADENKNISKEVEGLKIDRIIATFYNRDNVQDVIRRTERIYRTQKNEINYKLIKEKNLLQYSLLSRNKVQFIAEEFERLANEYNVIMTNHHRGIITTLDEALKNNIKVKKENVEAKKTSLNALFRDASASYETLIDLPRLKELLRKLPK
ncbi:MAG: hypothetical protein NZ551_06375 [Microscillaceae bacterium]|nr:hypothetical protein [Microscillaceae bacterium]MDW8460819.1 hypothetical protein [Cytophagales bacterium]